MPRTATIRARTFCDLYRLDKRQFDRVIERYPAFKESIKELAERRRQEIEAAAKAKT
jgi:voltage-gated potassium channel